MIAKKKSKVLLSICKRNLKAADFYSLSEIWQYLENLQNEIWQNEK